MTAGDSTNRGGGANGSLRWLVAGCLAAALSSAITAPRAALAQSTSTYYRHGLRWIGRAAECQAGPRGWLAARLFSSPTSKEAAQLCTYRWAGAGHPGPQDVGALLQRSGAKELTEDVPVLVAMGKGGGPPPPSQQWSPPEVAYYQALRSSLRQQVGEPSLLAPWWPDAARVRLAVIDTAPTAGHGAITPGLDRHGDTLAYLIRELTCRAGSDGAPAADCPLEVTSELALPWVTAEVSSPAGGHLGSLVDLAQAIERATEGWKADRARSPAGLPAHLILNLSVGWEHTPGIADCFADPSAPVAPPALAVREALRHAAQAGALIFAAAGNDPGGKHPPKGLTCPGAYQRLLGPRSPQEPVLDPVLYAVSGVDYRDEPLETVRRLGISSLAGLGFAGVAWGAADPMPPLLTGSSVATAVAAAVAALAWTARPERSAGEVARALYDGGRDLSEAEQCALPFGAPCRSRRVSTCGALLAIGAPSPCTPPPPRAWSSLSLPAELAQLTSWFAGAPRCASPSAGCSAPILLPQDPPQPEVPRYQLPSFQVEPWTFPMPISATCPTCWVAESLTASDEAARLYLPALGQTLTNPVLVVRLDNQQRWAIPLDDLELKDGSGAFVLLESSAHTFPLGQPLPAPITAAYLSGFDAELQHSVTEQLYVHR